MEKLYQINTSLAFKNQNTKDNTVTSRALLVALCMPTLVMSQAAYADYTYRQVCSSPVMVCVGPTGQESCTATTYCHWEIESTGASGSQSGSTPPSAPNPQTGGPSSTTTPSIEDVEKEAHKKFCKSFPVKIAAAVSDCSASAKGYRSYVVGVKCSSSGTITWDLKFSRDGLESGFSTTFSPGADCRENAQLAMDATIARCESNGLNASAALAKQCADVN